MGSRGPQPTPTAILKLRNSPVAKERTGEPQPMRGKPRCPSKLAGEHKRIWEKLIEILDDMDVVTTADGWQLERYARYFVRWRQVEEAIEKMGENHLAIAAGEKTGPAFRHLSRESMRLDTAMKQVEACFGLSPAARARLGCLLHGGGEKVIRDEVEERFFGGS